MTICISIPSNNFIFAESDEESYLKEDKAITESLGSNMIYAPHTGNVNLDYLYQMIQHHKGAIDMAKNLLNNGGENEEVVQIAKDIIKNQTLTCYNGIPGDGCGHCPQGGGAGHRAAYQHQPGQSADGMRKPDGKRKIPKALGDWYG